jgi:hypothetical protein
MSASSILTQDLNLNEKTLTMYMQYTQNPVKWYKHKRLNDKNKMIFFGKPYVVNQLKCPLNYNDILHLLKHHPKDQIGYKIINVSSPIDCTEEELQFFDFVIIPIFEEFARQIDDKYMKCNFIYHFLSFFSIRIGGFSYLKPFLPSVIF